MAGCRDERLPLAVRAVGDPVGSAEMMRFDEVRPVFPGNGNGQFHRNKRLFPRPGTLDKSSNLATGSAC